MGKVRGRGWGTRTRAVNRGRLGVMEVGGRGQGGGGARWESGIE